MGGGGGEGGGGDGGGGGLGLFGAKGGDVSAAPAAPTAPAPILSFQTEFTPGNVNNPAGELNVSAEPGTGSREVTGPTGGASPAPVEIVTAPVLGSTGGRDPETNVPTPTVEAPGTPVQSPNVNPSASVLGLPRSAKARGSREQGGTAGGGTTTVKDPLGLIRRRNSTLLG